MTLLTRHIEAGWHEVETNVGKAAERFLNRPGATSSVLRVEAPSQGLLHEALDLRESQLAGVEAPIKDTITNDGALVTGDQHVALQTDGLVVPGPEADSTADEAKDAEIESLRAQLAEAQASAAPADQGSQDNGPQAPPEGEQAEAGAGQPEDATEPPADQPQA